jgi:Domain of unknown function (DUF1906)
MPKIIDTNNETTQKLAQLKSAGIECVIRYISTNTAGEKVVKPAEARAIAAAGLKLALVFEVFGGANDFVHDDIDAESGAKHGDFARQWATNVGAPANTIIWFAIDTDCSTSQYERLVKPYLAAAKVALGGQYRIGVYACGFVCGRVLDENLVDATWLTQSMGFNGSRAFRDSRRWRLLQGPETTFAGLSIDSDEANGDDYGAFVPFQAPALQPAVTSQTVPQPDAPASPQIDLARIEQDIARLGQIAATFSQFANTLGQLPTAGLPPQIAAIEQTVTRLGQIAGTLSQFATALSARSSSAVAPAAPVLSPIDKALGGQAMVGLKTPLAIGAYALMWILQGANVVGTATGDKATTTGSVLTALIAAFGGLGVTAKFDRAFQAIGAMAPAIQKLAAIGLMLPKI